MELKEIYLKLYNDFGKQGWWPLSKGSLHTKHHKGAPESEKDIFEIIVGAILTQYMRFSWGSGFLYIGF